MKKFGSLFESYGYSRTGNAALVSGTQPNSTKPKSHNQHGGALAAGRETHDRGSFGPGRETCWPGRRNRMQPPGTPSSCPEQEAVEKNRAAEFKTLQVNRTGNLRGERNADYMQHQSGCTLRRLRKDADGTCTVHVQFHSSSPDLHPSSSLPTSPYRH